jgi:hypothetical protein
MIPTDRILGGLRRMRTETPAGGRMAPGRRQERMLLVVPTATVEPMPRTPDPTPELIAIPSDVLAAGGPLDDAARGLMQSTESPILAIKTPRIAQPGLSLVDAKPIVDRNLSPSAQQARDDLLDEIERGLSEAE